MIRKIGALFAGTVVAMMLVGGIEAIGHAVYPPPEGLDLKDPEQLRAYVPTLPFGAFLFVIAAYAFATLIGGIVAGVIAREQTFLFAGVIGALVLLGTIVNLMMIPHPVWFAVTAIVVIVVMAVAASLVGRRLTDG